MAIDTTTEREAPAATKYLEDLFKNARACDREIGEIRDEIDALLDAARRGPLSQDEAGSIYDLTVDLLEAADSLHAAIAPAALQRAEDLARALPGYVSAIHRLLDDQADLERTMRPMFEQAGIAERFLSVEQR